MGSSFKSSNGHRARPYALMLLLAFGAAILGVMVLHKLREKRIFSLLVKEKDHELLTLHLLFQREKEINKEAKKKIEEMKTKVYSLRSQKLELDRRLLEMESMIAALRDERKVIESTLEEKKIEMKLLTEEGVNSSSNELSRVSLLQDVIKMKEIEIEDLKFRLNRTDNARSFTHVSELNSTSAGRRVKNKHGRQFHLLDSTVKATKGVDGTEADSIIERRSEHATNGTENLNTEDNDELRMKREAAEYRGTNYNGGILVSADEAQQKKTVDTQNGDKVPQFRDVKTDNTSSYHSPQDQEAQGVTNLHKSEQKVKPNEAGSDLGFRGRRRHSRGKRLRDIARNRKSSDSLYSGNLEAVAVTNQDSHGESQIQKEAGSRNQTQETASDGQGLAKEAEITEVRQISAETKSSGIQVAEAVITKGGSVSAEENKEHVEPQLTTEGESAKQQITDQSQSHDMETNRKLLNNERKEEIDSEAEAEDPDDPEIREPEIDMADIKRFAESDPDEEEADEAAEETEF